MTADRSGDEASHRLELFTISRSTIARHNDAHSSQGPRGLKSAVRGGGSLLALKPAARRRIGCSRSVAGCIEHRGQDSVASERWRPPRFSAVDAVVVARGPASCSCPCFTTSRISGCDAASVLRTRVESAEPGPWRAAHARICSSPGSCPFGTLLRVGSGFCGFGCMWPAALQARSEGKEVAAPAGAGVR